MTVDFEYIISDNGMVSIFPVSEAAIREYNRQPEKFKFDIRFLPNVKSQFKASGYTLRKVKPKPLTKKDWDLLDQLS